MNRRTAIRWWTLAGLLVAVIAWADYVGVMADEDTGTVALSSLEARIANWNAITGTPTTVAGYGITDGATESWVIDYVVANTTPIDMTNEPAFRGWTNIWQTLITAHLTNTVDNPHGITPAKIGAATGTPLYVESDPSYTGAVTKAGFNVSEASSNAWDAATQTLSIKANYLEAEADPAWTENSDTVLSHLADTNTNPHGITRTMLGAAYTGDVVYAIAANGITNTPDGDGLIDLGTVGGDNTTTVTGQQIKVGSELNVTPDYGYAIGKRSGVTADNGIALGYRASVTSQNSFVWSDASSEDAFNSPGSNTFSVRATGGILLNGPMAGPLNMGGQSITNADVVGYAKYESVTNFAGSGGVKTAILLSYDSASDYSFTLVNNEGHIWGAWKSSFSHEYEGTIPLFYTPSGTYALWQGRVNDAEASRIAALAEVNAGSIVGATVSVGSPLAVTTNAGVLAFTVPAGGGNLTATNTPTSGQMLYASGTDNATLYWAAAPEGGGTGGGGGGDAYEAFRAYTTLSLADGTALVARTSGRWLMIEANDGVVTLDVDAASYTNALEGIQHNVMWVRGTNATYAIATNNVANGAYVDCPPSTTNHLLLEKRPGWSRFQIWQDNR